MDGDEAGGVGMSQLLAWVCVGFILVLQFPQTS